MARRTDTPVAELMNIGATVTARLAKIGIHTRGDLARVGAAAAYARLREHSPGKTVPVCYYLYSLDAALKGVHWDDLPEPRKRSLRRAAGVER